MQEEILTRHHPSYYRNQIYVYPVVSRRAKGISVGINLSPTALCNFHCIYCQVESSIRRKEDDHSQKDLKQRVDWARFDQELRNTVDLIRSGRIFEDPHFAHTDPEKRYFRDFALSGDGEPTLSPDFPEAVHHLVQIRKDLDLSDVKLVLITNGTLLRQDSIRRALDELVANHGEIWVKLDAGTEAEYRSINRSPVLYSTIISNIKEAAIRWPIVLQTILLKKGGISPSLDEIRIWCDHVNDFIRQGGQILRLQIYTVARTPAEDYVSSLDDEEMDRFARIIGAEVPLPLETFYSC